MDGITIPKADTAATLIRTAISGQSQASRPDRDDEVARSAESVRYAQKEAVKVTITETGRTIADEQSAPFQEDSAMNNSPSREEDLIDHRGLARDGTLTEERNSSNQARVSDMERIDRRVRSTEQAKFVALGPHSRGGVTFEYEQGPNGQQYAVDGKVPINSSPSTTPEQTIRKADTIRRAAMNYGKLSKNDRKQAAIAEQLAHEARAQMARMATAGVGEGAIAPELTPDPGEEEVNPYTPRSVEINLIGAPSAGAIEPDAESIPESVGLPATPGPIDTVRPQGEVAKPESAGMEKAVNLDENPPLDDTLDSHPEGEIGNESGPMGGKRGDSSLNLFA